MFLVEVAINLLHDMSNSQDNLSERRSNYNSSVMKKLEKKQISNKEKNVFRAISYVHQGYKVLILMRGLPGSGKSYLAREIVEKSTKSNNYVHYIFSTDDFFITRSGNYNFNPQKLGDAHAWNQHRVWMQIMQGTSPIIIDNTNACMWEMKPYATMAVSMGYVIEIIEPFTCWAFNVKELHVRNQHNVPKDKIRDMLERYEKNITPQKILSAFNLQYKVALPKGNLSVNSLNRIVGIQNKSELIEEATFPPGNEANLLETCSSHKQGDYAMPILDFESLTIEDNSLYSDLNSWGVNDNILHSWDIVTHLPVPILQNGVLTFPKKDSEKEIHKNDADTNTHQEDFEIICGAASNENIKYLTACGRDINVNTSIKETKPMKKSVLDKSSMTIEENLLIPKSDSDDIEELSQLFPYIPEEQIQDVYERCGKDIHWVVELLLESNIMVLPKSVEEKNDQEETTKITEINLIGAKNAKIPEETDKTTIKAIPEESEGLKRFIEEKVKINPAYYSENVLKIKQQRERVTSESSEYDLMTFDEISHNFPQINPKKEIKNEKISSYETIAGAVLAGDSDIDSSDASDSDLSSDPNEEKFVQLNLGEDAIQQLEMKFGDPNLMYPKGFLPIVQVPIALARQLHAVYLESVYQQLDTRNEVLETLVKEDEEFAKKLHAQELESFKRQQPPDLKEIMEEQVALNVYKRETEEWRKLTPDDLASKLTRQKLFNSFPTVDKEVLVEILQAHDNCYVDTIDSLIASMPNLVGIPDENLKEPPISSSTLEDMKSACDETPEVSIFNLLCLIRFIYIIYLYHCFFSLRIYR